MPNHCYYTSTTPPIGSDLKFEAYSVSGAFNLRPSQMQSFSLDQLRFEYTSATTQAEYDALMCDDKWAKTSRIDGRIASSERVYYNFQYPIAFHDEGWDSEETSLLNLKSSDSVVGIALNGVLLFASTSQFGYDAFFPQAHGTKAEP